MHNTPASRCLRNFSKQFFFALALCVMVSSANAQAIVVQSSLSDHPVQAGVVTTALVRFNVGIELALTKMFLVNASGEEQVLSLMAGTHPGEIEIKIPPLTPGAYALRYKTFAADGHLTENILRFSVVETP